MLCTTDNDAVVQIIASDAICTPTLSSEMKSATGSLAATLRTLASFGAAAGHRVKTKHSPAEHDLPLAWVNMSVTMLHSLRLNVTYNICVRDKALRVRQPVSCVITTWTLTTSHLSLQLSAQLMRTHHCATLLAARSPPST